MPLCICFGQCWVFVAARGLSLPVSKGALSGRGVPVFHGGGFPGCGARVAKACGLCTCGPWPRSTGPVVGKGLVVPRLVGSSQARAQPQSCGFYCWATREAQSCICILEESWLRWRIFPTGEEKWVAQVGWSAGVRGKKDSLSRVLACLSPTSTAKQFSVAEAVLRIVGCWATPFPPHPSPE